jgi:hypothetical protein
MDARPTIWSYVRLLLCLGSAYLVALLFSLDARDPVGVWVTCLGNWLAIWLFCEVRPLRDEHYSWRMLLCVFKYGPLALFLFVVTLVTLCDWLSTFYQYPPPSTGSVAVAYT